MIRGPVAASFYWYQYQTTISMDGHEGQNPLLDAPEEDRQMEMIHER